MSLYSYHIFYFPFRWSLPASADCILSEQMDLKQIPISDYSMWERVQLDTESKAILTESEFKDACELFGERQYFFEFVHPILYDVKGEKNPLIYHYERREPKNREVLYQIQVKDQIYSLRVDAMNLNLYSTGVGILAFFLANECEGQNEDSAVLAINQFGRRIMPPHSGEFEPTDRSLIATSIKIVGLNGLADDKYEDSFDYEKRLSENKRGLNDVWNPARFIKSLISDLSPELDIVPIIDDRMLVNCWYGNDRLSRQVKDTADDEKSEFIMGNFWYKYVFVDTGDNLNDDTCQNDAMKEQLLKDATYFRWQKQGTLFGVSRYSFVAVTNAEWFGLNVLSMHMRTIYSRLFELIIVQRASMLRFSAEVTKVSALSGSDRREIARRVSSLYKEYIRFVNQIYFRSVTLQDQGIELYEMLMNQFASQEQIKDLDEEIEELHRYVMLLVDQSRNDNGAKLNLLAAIFLPGTFLAGLFGMNKFCELEMKSDFWIHLGVILLVSIISYWIIKKWRR